MQCERPVTVRGKTIGGAAPLVCLPLVAKDAGDLMLQARELVSLAPDLLEWRIDGFGNVENIGESLQALAGLRAVAGSLPLIFTCRIDSEGGMRAMARETRLKLITASIETGLLDLVDIELCNDAAFIETVLDTAKRHDVKVILSFHDFEKTPGEDVILERLVRAQQMGGHIAKVAVMPQNYHDVLVLLGATLKARTAMLQIPVVTMAMGNEGVVTRLAGGLFGSDITFAIGKNASAPGQILIGELRKAMSILYSERSD